jgi:hypothetical protein
MQLEVDPKGPLSVIDELRHPKRRPYQDSFAPGGGDGGTENSSITGPHCHDHSLSDVFELSQHSAMTTVRFGPNDDTSMPSAAPPSDIANVHSLSIHERARAERPLEGTLRFLPGSRRN